MTDTERVHIKGSNNVTAGRDLHLHVHIHPGQLKGLTMAAGLVLAATFAIVTIVAAVFDEDA